MASGGKRNRSGPAPDPNSRTSERRAYSLSALPATGFTGRVPAFPLPDATARERAVWKDLWRTPQAWAWAQPSEKWRIPQVAMYARVKVRCEAVDANAALYAQLHRFEDKIGLTTAGLAEMGWKIALDEVAAKASSRPTPRKAEEQPKRRLSSVPSA